MPGIPNDAHPRDLSERQKLALVLAIQLGAASRVLLLGEPNCGLDYRAKTELVAIVDVLVAEGRAVVMAEGGIVTDGPSAEVIVASPVFAPQTAKILVPQPFLTDNQVRSLLDEDSRS